MDLRKQEVLVVGAGLSGVAACRFLLGRGARVTLSDNKNIAALPAEAQALMQQGVEFLPQQNPPAGLPWRLVVKSPGVPPGIPVLTQARQAGIPIWGELELAYRYAKAPFIAITGTNGKTTTTALLGYLLHEAGKKVLVGGNIGAPLIGQVEGDYEYIVAETSSFQLEDSEQFRAHVALLLNLSPDHLDRHGDMEHYLAAKARVLRHQQAEDFAVLNYDDAALRPLAEQTPAQVLWFSLENVPPQGVFLADGQIFIREQQKNIHVMPANGIYIKGRHNWQNAMAAVAAAYALGVDAAVIARALAGFPGVEHRLEFVCEKDGIIYVNDSKGTNPDSTEKALLAYDKPLVLIAGGYDKQADFAPLMPLIKQRARHMVVLGQTAEQLRQTAAAAGYTEVSRAESFEEAVALARQAAQSGDVVLLSPACASWDMFENFEARGNRFKELVRQSSIIF